MGFATFASASRPNIHNDSEQKKYRRAITHMPVRAPLPIDNGQNNQYEIEKLMHPVDASEFITSVVRLGLCPGARPDLLRLPLCCGGWRALFDYSGGLWVRSERMFR
ncbi:MAG: hypothetical protein K8R34_06955 [Methanosarcinales archaeon]|nr:hypothetical protein [Methanosarcinales archaeon]